MKITDTSVTLLAWDDIPQTRYGQHTGLFSGSSQLGLLRLQTDEGVDGLQEEIEVDADALVHAIDAPGLGAVIDFDLIERKKVAVL